PTPSLAAACTLPLHDALPICCRGSSSTPPRRRSATSRLVAPAPIVTHDPGILELDHAAAHLVHHLAVVRRHHHGGAGTVDAVQQDRKSTRLNSSHQISSYAVF